MTKSKTPATALSSGSVFVFVLMMIASIRAHMAATAAMGSSHGGGNRKTGAIPATIAIERTVIRRDIGRCLTISVYQPRCNARRDQDYLPRLINHVGLNRREVLAYGVAGSRCIPRRPKNIKGIVRFDSHGEKSCCDRDEAHFTGRSCSSESKTSSFAPKLQFRWQKTSLYATPCNSQAKALPAAPKPN